MLAFGSSRPKRRFPSRAIRPLAPPSFSDNPSSERSISLETGAGTIRVELEREGDWVAFGQMSQPIPRVESCPDVAELFAGLGVPGSKLEVDVYDNGVRHVFVMLEDEAAVSGLSPDFARLGRLPILATVSAFAGGGERWKTRVFAPAAGVNEDPATGSAAGPLALHLARHGLIPFGQRIRIEQGAEIERPSVLFACAHGAADRVERIEVGGSAIVVARGEFRLP